MICTVNGTSTTISSRAYAAFTSKSVIRYNAVLGLASERIVSDSSRAFELMQDDNGRGAIKSYENDKAIIPGQQGTFSVFSAFADADLRFTELAQQYNADTRWLLSSAVL